MISYEEIRVEEVEKDFKELCVFTGTEEFQGLLMELRNTPRNDRKDFVQKVILNQEELRNRGIHVPEGMVIQRSIFADGRPTLFCVSKYLRDAKRKITITYDDAEEQIRRGKTSSEGSLYYSPLRYGPLERSTLQLTTKACLRCQLR